MSGDQSFDDLMTRLRGGDQNAATEIFVRFRNRLIALARSRLDGRIRRKIDPEDVVDSAYKSFFFGVNDQRISPADWESLWSLLAVITLRKCGHQIDYFHAACRDVGRELTPQTLDGESMSSWNTIARDPTPLEAAALSETIDNLMRRIGARDRQIVSLTLQGLSSREISAQLRCSERTVRRALAWVKTLLEKMRHETAAVSQRSGNAERARGN